MQRPITFALKSLFALGILTTPACSASSPTPTATTSSALAALSTADVDGGIDPNANACLATYVACLRVPSDAATCKTALIACASAPPLGGDGGSAGAKCNHGGGHGGLADDGDADDAAIAACLASLDQCAAGSATADVCTGAAATCLAAARPRGRAGDGDRDH